MDLLPAKDWNHKTQVLLSHAQCSDVLAILAIFFAAIACTTQGVLRDRPDPYRHKLFEKPQARAGTSRGVQRVQDLQERLDLENANIAILWASQSGTAERLAGRLAKELRRNFGAKALPIDVSDIDPSSLMKVAQDKIVIVMASTFGEGDPSDNLHRMWSWLNTTADISLSNIRFLAFGLGNSNYKYYNKVIDVLVEHLRSRGAQMLMETGKADDAAGETEEHFLEWKQSVFDFFQGTLCYERQNAQYEPSIEITDDTDTSLDGLWSGMPHVVKASSTQSKCFTLPIVRSHNLLQSSTDRTCLHMDLDISQSPNLKYKTGDHLAVWPVNPSEEVQILLRALGLEDKCAAPISIKSLDGSSIPIPTPTTLQDALRYYLEICAPVSRETIDSLITYAPTEESKAFLQGISKDKASHSQYSKSQYLNLGRLVQAASPLPGAWSSVPLSLVLEMLPTMQPRFYSISSSSVVSPRQISITVVVSDTTTTDSPDRVIGLATNYLLSAKDEIHPKGLIYSQSLQSGQVHAAVRRSTFKLPMTSSSPVLMVGAGTGVAPFRAFVQERARLRSVGRNVGTTRLIFGCRNASQDLLYGADFADWTKPLGDCFSMTTAFSRPENKEDKEYVQDAILKDPEALCKLLIDENAYFYICGSAAMARDVSAAIAEVLKSQKGWSDDSIKEFADRQKRQRRWLQDVWG